MATSNTLVGVGLGLRWPLIDSILAEPPPELSWLEVAPENYIGRGGRFRKGLERCAAKFPIVTHGLTLSLGGPDPLDQAYTDELRNFTSWLSTPWHSDHLCFSEVGGIATHELLPLPMNDAMASHLAERIRRAQDALGIPMAVENVSSYARMPGSSMSEAEFVATVCERADCRLLLDVNNVYVNSKNHGFDAREMIAALPLDRVEQLHVAGHEQKPGGGLLDTHAEAVCEDVWNLLEWTLERTGPRPVLLERDGSFPAWAEVVREIRRCHEVADRAERRRFGRVASKVSPNLECACP